MDFLVTRRGTMHRRIALFSSLKHPLNQTIPTKVTQLDAKLYTFPGQPQSTCIIFAVSFKISSKNSIY